MEKNQIFQTVIEDMSEQGEGIGKVNGYTLFIKDTVIGDRIEGKVIKAKKNYGFGRMMKVLEPSPFRVKPACSVAAPCGGCQLQAVSYERQLKFKEDKVKNHLLRIGGFSEECLPMKPIIGMEEMMPFGDKWNATESSEVYRYEGCGPFRYRNKGQFPFGRSKDGRIIYGFYAGRTHSIIEAEDCLLGAPVNRKILDTIRSFMEEYKIEPYDELCHGGLVRHALIRVGYHTGEIMVCLVINGDRLPGSRALAERLMEMEGMTSVSLNINKEKTNVILGEKMIYLAGQPYITDKIGDLSYRISPQSFYQVNPVQTERLYGKALEFAGLTGRETVWDLYCGIGTISLFLARKARQVYGVEIVPAAIENAKENAALNGLSNTEFFVGRAEEVLPRWYREHEGAAADVIVVDPPRKGCDEALLNTMVQMHPERIVYVSCDSATLARDLKYLCGEGYELQRVQPVDMFPQGVHVETVVLMSRVKE
ncbi:MAG: 23S rRNA (uracil(1939)-C(5))-methyltransferase RlmD [Lachnospiraceae bacterium]|nr:23S rRNA (uracil(1939)-C(5))-methyltransferase RlmD [Lachnospiraceae bacterium]